MRYIIFSLFLSILFMACTDENSSEKISFDTIEIQYPETQKDDSVIDSYFDNEVPDPYRWLEDDMSEETGEWVRQQNVTTNDYLKEIPFRDAIKERLTELWNYEKYSAPFIRGDYTYFYKND